MISRNNSLTKRPSKTQEDENVDLDSDDENLGYINEELKKVKILRISKERMRVSGNEYIKKQELMTTELKDRVRLSIDILPTEF